MSAESFRAAGFKAIEERRWTDAIESLTKAITQSRSPAWLLARSQAYMETGQLDEAIADADYAYCTAVERGNDKSRKQMIEAQYRRSVCFFRKKEYANADKCAVWSMRLAKGVAVKQGKIVEREGVNDKGYYFASAAQELAEAEKEKTGSGTDNGTDAKSRVSAIMGGQTSSATSYDRDWNKAQIFRSQVLNFLEALPEDDPARKITMKLTPEKPNLGPFKLDDKGKLVETKPAPLMNAPMAAPMTASTLGSSGFRTQFYQNDTSITLTVFMKFSSKDEMEKVEVRFLEDGKSIVVDGVPRLPRLLYIETHDRISASKSTWRAAMMKLEFTLVKEVPGKWPDFGIQSKFLPPSVCVNADSSLAEWVNLPSTGQINSEERSENGISDPSHGSEHSASSMTRAASSASTITTSTAPTYPTSSKLGPKDWDKFGEDDDEEDGDAKDVEHFFKQLYKDSTPEQQRAMMKSYIESNGTSLSTDWNEVSKGKVETNPPDGVEAKKWVP